MSKAWKSISVDEAKENSLYGVGGWLVVFAISVFFGLILAIGLAKTVILVLSAVLQAWILVAIAFNF